MKRLALALIIALGMAAHVFAQNANQHLDSLMTSCYRNDQPGAAIAVVKDGRVVFKKGYGIADLATKAPITPATNFNICSMTKQFTAYGILTLANRKKLSLSDHLKKFFPGFDSTMASHVTVRNLLTHSSGIVDHYDHVDKARFAEFWDKDVLAAVAPVDSVYFPAGTRYRYSNTAFCLLALVIEELSGKSYPDFMRANIFEPLKMKESDVIKPGFSIRNRAFGYEFEKDSFRLADAKQSLFFSTEGDGGIYTSIDDYLKWVRAIQTHKGLNPALVEEAQSPQFTIDSARALSYGYGWFVAGSGANKVVYHTGSNGGFRTIVFMKPAENYSVVIFSNRTGVDLEDLIRVINRLNGVDDHAIVKLDSLIS